MKTKNGQYLNKDFKLFRILLAALTLAICGGVSTVNATAALESWSTDGGNKIFPRANSKPIAIDNIEIDFRDEEVVYLNFDAPPNDLTFRMGFFNKGVKPSISKFGFRFENVNPSNAPSDLSFLNALDLLGLAAGTAPAISVSSRDADPTNGVLQIWFDIGSPGFVEDTGELAFRSITWDGFELFDKQKGFSLNIGINDSSLDLASQDDVSNIPVPAAIWFFGTGLAGLLFSRRKNG